MVAQIDREMVEARPAKIPGRLAAWALIEGRPLTTKGQWINPMVKRLFSLAQAFPARKGADEPIFIIGTGRSGTTVLGKLFAVHRQTVFLNEPKAIWHYVHDGEDLIGTYAAGEASVRLDEDDAEPKMALRMAKVYSWAMRWGFAQRVVDKYPELVFRVPFALALFPRARFIAILRNGVDACSSVRNWSRRNADFKGEEVHDWWGRDDRKWRLLVQQIVPAHPDLAPLRDKLLQAEDHIDRAALEWIVSMREVLAASDRHAEVLAIHYEDLCAKPAETLDRITRHCGLEPDQTFVDYARTILDSAEPYGEIDLMPELVDPFSEMLEKLGYGASVKRVGRRVQ